MAERGVRTGAISHRVPRRQAVLLLWAGLTIVVMAAATEATEYAVNYGNADTGRWSCRLCGFDGADAHSGALLIGGLRSAGGEMRFGRDSGIDRAGRYLNLNASYNLTSRTGALLEFTSRNLGLDSRAAELRVHRPQRYGVRLQYREIPRNVARDGRSPFLGTQSLSLPDDWVPAFGTGAMTQLRSSSRPVELATKRQQSDAQVWYNLSPGLTLKAGFSRERKSGVEETSRDFLYQAAALPLPIDYRVETTDAGLYHESSMVSLAVSLARRRFENGSNQLAWENPYYGFVSTGRSAAAPDNVADTLSFVSRVRLGRSTTLNATLVRGDARQNAPFLPSTSNPFIDVPPISESSLDANRESRSAAVNLVSRPTPRLRINVAHAETDRRDHRAHLTVNPVLGDLFATGPVVAEGYDYKRARTQVGLRYRSPRGPRVAAGFRRVDTDRSRLEITANDEDAAWLEVSSEIGAGWEWRVRRARATRRASEFVANTLNDPRTRRYYQVQRRAEEWSAGMRFDSRNARLSLGLDASRRQYRYPDSPLGLQRDAVAGWSLDLTYVPWTTASLSGFYGAQSGSSETSGSVAFPTRDWLYDIDENVTTAGMRLRINKFLDRAIALTVDYAYSDGISDYATTLQAVRSSFPRLISRHESVDVRWRYAWKPRTTLVVRYYFERFRAADWAIDGIEQDSIRNVLAFGRSSPDYGNHLISLSIESRL